MPRTSNRTRGSRLRTLELPHRHEDFEVVFSTFMSVSNPNYHSNFFCLEILSRLTHYEQS